MAALRTDELETTLATLSIGSPKCLEIIRITPIKWKTTRWRPRDVFQFHDHNWCGSFSL